MAYGKSLEKPEPHMVKVYHNNGQPLKRARPKERMSKKERLLRRREEKELGMKSAEELRMEREAREHGQK
jgi:hypothetical protein